MSPAGGGWGGREGVQAEEEEPEGGTDGRDGGRAGWRRAREGRGVLVETAPPPPRPAGQSVASTAGGAVPGACSASFPSRFSLAPRGRREPGPRGAHVARPCLPHVARPGARSPAGMPHTVSQKKQKQKQTTPFPGGLRMAISGFGSSRHRLWPQAPSPTVIERCRAAELLEWAGRSWVGKAGRCPEDPVRDGMPDTAESRAKCLVHLKVTREFWGFQGGRA